MSHITIPRFFLSSCGNRADRKLEPSVPKLLLLYVVPLSLLPPLMYVYAQTMHPGAILPRLEPGLSINEVLLTGAAFVLIEILAVALMAMFIQQLGSEVGTIPSYGEAYALAATAPTPLWLATLGLILPNLWINIAFLAIAWVFSVGLIRRGVQVLFMPHDDSRTHHLANTLTFVGVMTWFALLLFLVLLLSIIVGWR
jgi:hypothetical protein